MTLARESLRSSNVTPTAGHERISGTLNLRRLSARVSSNLGVQSPMELIEGMPMIDPKRLKKLKRLSKSSYAVVEQALLRPEGAPEDSEEGIKVAVKRLRQSAYTERDIIMFAKEAELLVQLEQHPCVGLVLAVSRHA